MNSYVMVLPVTGNMWRVFELMREENVTGFWTGGDGVDLLQWFIEQVSLCLFLSLSYTKMWLFLMHHIFC